MSKVVAEITMSLDGFVAGPNATLELPLGEGGEQLHDWAVELAAWRERHGKEGGGQNADSERMARAVEATGAVVMGRRMFSGGEGPWESDPNADGWWGDDPPFRVPVFVLTHHPRATVQKQGGTTFTFVEDGIESAVEQAKAAAGERNVSVAGGASAIQQAVRAGLVDELELHIAPLLLGSGTRLFDDLGPDDAALERVDVVGSPKVTHITYRVRNA
ncbi:MAG TPA: dihydrofolate reductase family protein [Gaiellaceae bacterium]|nr:dihydrofolate reductase family protein [Gaiellaceae bacterium]